MLVVSTAVYGGEREFGVMVHATVYVLIPLFLLMYAARDVQDNLRTDSDVPKIPRSTLIYIVSIISIVVALFFLYYAYYVITNADSLGQQRALNSQQSATEISASLTIIALIAGPIALILLIGSIGMLFKVNICRYLAITASCAFFILGFPVAIAFFLCEKDVKALFGKESK